MNRAEIQFNQSVLIVVDMQQVYLEGADFETFDWQNIVANVRLLLDNCRRMKIPVIFIRMWFRPDGSNVPRKFPRLEDGTPSYAVAGNKETEISNDLTPRSNEIVINKQRMSGFFQTNLELTLKHLKARHLIITGVSTDACVLTTVHDAYFRDYEISIVKDACGSETKAAHMTSILNMANWVYGCSIFTAAELIKALKGEQYQAWYWKRPGEYMYTLATIQDMYDQI